MRSVLSTVFTLLICLSSARGDELRAFLGKTVEGWKEIIRSDSATRDERRQALWALGCFGQEARPAVPDLLELVHRGELKDEAIGALTAIGAHPELAVPRLIATYIKEGCQHRTGQGAIGFNPETEDALVRIGEPTVPALIDILKGPNRDMRVCAAAALGRIGPAARAAIPMLIQAAKSADKDYLSQILQRHATIALGQIGPEARDIAPTLRRQLAKCLRPASKWPWPGPEVPDLATALKGVGEPPVQMLVDKLLRGDESSGAEAMYLSRLGPSAREAIPVLRRALADRRRQVRVPVAIALAFIDPRGTEPIPVLIEALKHLEDQDINPALVIEALAKLGPKAHAALPRLIVLLGEECDRDLCKAVVQIDPEGRVCVPALISVLKDEDYQVVHIAADCLALLGPKAKDAVPALAALLTREFGEAFANGYEPQASATRALRTIGPAARPAIPALIKALKFRDHVHPHENGFDGFDGGDEYPDCTGAEAAADVLGSFGAEARIAVPALIEAVQLHEKDEYNWYVRLKAIEALGRIGPDARPAIPVLRNLMKEKKDNPQYMPVILGALYRLAPDGKELAQQWLDASVRERFLFRMQMWVEGRALLFSVMGRTSVEADYLTRVDLLRFDRTFTPPDPEADDPPLPFAQWWPERLGRFGVGSRKAIPRLRELQKHPSPWVRMWATEALERINRSESVNGAHR